MKIDDVLAMSIKHGLIRAFPYRGARKAKFPTKFLTIEGKTIDPLLTEQQPIANLLFQSGQISDEMAICGH